MKKNHKYYFVIFLCFLIGCDTRNKEVSDGLTQSVTDEVINAEQSVSDYSVELLFDGENSVSKEVQIAQNQKVTVKVKTPVNIEFSAAFIGMAFDETMKCGMCLNFSSVASDGSVTSGASNFGGGFPVVQTINGEAVVDVFHDYSVPKSVNIEITKSEYESF